MPGEDTGRPSDTSPARARVIDTWLNGGVGCRRSVVVVIAVLLAWWSPARAAHSIALGEVHAELDVADEAGAVTLLVHSALTGPDASLVSMPADLTLENAQALLTTASVQHAIVMELSREGTGLRLTLAILGADGTRDIAYVRTGDGDVVTLAKGVVDKAVTICALSKRNVSEVPLGLLRPYARALRLRATNPDEAAAALADAVPATALGVSSVTTLLKPLDAVKDPTVAAIAARALRDGKRLSELAAGTDAAATGARALAALARSSTQEAEQAIGAKPPRHGLIAVAQVTLAENGSDAALLESRIKAGLTGDQVRPVLALAATLVRDRVSPGLHHALVAAAEKQVQQAPGVAARIGLNAAEAGVDVPRALALISARELETYDLTRLEALIAKRTDPTALRLRAELSMRLADGLEDAAIAKYLAAAPDDGRAHRYQGWVFAGEGKLAEAVTEFRKASATRELARVLVETGDPKAALLVVGAPVTAEDQVIVMHLALLEKRTQDAVTAATIAVRLAPVNPLVHRALIALDPVAPNPARVAISKLVIEQGTGIHQAVLPVATGSGSAVVSLTELDTGPQIKVIGVSIDPALVEPLLAKLTGLQQLRARTLLIAEMQWEPKWYSFKLAHSEPVKGAIVKVLSSPPYRLKLRPEPSVLPDGQPSGATLSRITADADAVLIYQLVITGTGTEVRLIFYEKNATDAALVSSAIKAPGLVTFNDSKLHILLAFIGVFLLGCIVYITRAKGRIKIKVERAPDVSDEVLCVEISKSPTRPRVDDPARFATETRKVGTVTKGRNATLIASGYTFKVSTGQWYVHLYGAFARAGKMLAVPATCTQEIMLERGQLAELKFDLTSKLAELRVEVVSTPRRGIPVWVAGSEHEKFYTDETGEAVLNLPVGTYTLVIETKSRKFERQVQITAPKQHRESINIERELRIEQGVKLDVDPESSEVDNPSGVKLKATSKAKAAAAVAKTTGLPGMPAVALQTMGPPPVSDPGISDDFGLAPSNNYAPPATAATAVSPQLSVPQSTATHQSRAQTPRPGDTLLGRYRITSELGRGAMGVVHRAWDDKLEREVAIKEMADDLRSHPEALRMFTQEAKALAQLNHTNIVAMYDQITDASGVYMIMEFVDGKPLADIARERGAMPWLEAVGIVDQVCSGLAYAHARKVIHRDIKPANCFVASDRTVKLGDFGLARVMREVIIHRTEIRGTPLYMAPEQITGTNVDQRADLYAIGCMLFELVTGRPPFIDGDILYAQMHLPPPRASTIVEAIPAALDELMLQLLSKQADDRPGSANEVRTAFKQLFNS